MFVEVGWFFLFVCFIFKSFFQLLTYAVQSVNYSFLLELDML